MPDDLANDDVLWVKRSRPYMPIVIALQLKYGLNFDEAVKRYRSVMGDQVVRWERVDARCALKR